MPRALLLTDADVFAGTERHMLDLAQALCRMDVPVRIACPTPSPLAERSAGRGIAVVDMPKRGLVDFAAVRRLAEMLRAGEIDVIHAHNGRTHLAAALAVSRAGRGSCVATQHFLAPSRTGRRGPKAWLSNAAHHWVSRRTARFIAISQAVRQEAVRRDPEEEGRFAVVLNGIEPPEAERLKAAAAVRRELGVAEGAPLVVCAARLQVEKDIPTLIGAMKHVGGEFPNARCVVAGEGDQRDVLERMIDDSGLQEKVRLLGFRADVLELMNAGDVFVLPSVAEPFGLVLLEAMALGKAVVATRAGGPCEIVEEGVTGLLAASKNSGEMGAALLRLMRDPVLRAAYGEAGRRRFLEHFTAQRMAAETLAVYHAAVKGASA